MAETLDSIARPIREEMKEFEHFFKKSLKTDVPLLEEVINHIFKQKGKQIRPLLIFLSSSLVGEINQRTYLSATAIEMLHTATLIHDDVVDEADERRGVKSVNAIWKSKVAVLVGDYLLSKALLLTTTNKAYDLLEIMTLPIQRMSEGELLQIEKSRLMDITEEVYFEIINKKTASLIGSCMATGARAVNGSDDQVKALKQIGEDLGIAFQIRDDIFDFQKTNLIGKPTGNDIVERKITLPLLYSLKQVDTKQQKQIIQLINEAANNKKNIELVREFVISNNGLDYAATIANKYRDKAIEGLLQFNDCPARQSLIDLAHYITERKK